MEMNIAVCDDCREDALHLKDMISGHNVELYFSGEQLLAAIGNNAERYQLYLLDIFLEEMSGLKLAGRIRDYDADAVICFVSTSDAFYREAYDLYAVQYLLKPVKQEALLQLLERVESRQAKNKEAFLRFKWRGKVGTIPYSNILFVSSREHKLFIYCRDGAVQECIGKMEKIAGQICGDVFLRVHQSFVVNMYCVDSLDGMEISMGDHRIPVSRRYYAEVKKRYHEILFEEMN